MRRSAAVTEVMNRSSAANRMLYAHDLRSYHENPCIDMKDNTSYTGQSYEREMDEQNPQNGAGCQPLSRRNNRRPIVITGLGRLLRWHLPHLLQLPRHRHRQQHQPQRRMDPTPQQMQHLTLPHLRQGQGLRRPHLHLRKLRPGWRQVRQGPHRQGHQHLNRSVLGTVLVRLEQRQGHRLPLQPLRDPARQVLLQQPLRQLDLLLTTVDPRRGRSSTTTEEGRRGRTPPPPAYWPTWSPGPPWCRQGTDVRLSSTNVRVPQPAQAPRGRPFALDSHHGTPTATLVRPTRQTIPWPKLAP